MDLYQPWPAEYVYVTLDTGRWWLPFLRQPWECGITWLIQKPNVDTTVLPKYPTVCSISVLRVRFVPSVWVVLYHNQSTRLTKAASLVQLLLLTALPVQLPQFAPYAIHYILSWTGISSANYVALKFQAVSLVSPGGRAWHAMRVGSLFGVDVCVIQCSVTCFIVRLVPTQQRAQRVFQTYTFWKLQIPNATHVRRSTPIVFNVVPRMFVLCAWLLMVLKLIQMLQLCVCLVLR